MLILGEKYKFTNIELKKLNKKFDKVDIVKYAARPFAEVQLQIEGLLKNHNYKFLIINTKEFIDPKMIKFLTLLQFRFNHKRFKILTIEKFLEKFFHKCYIPDDGRDLEFLSNIRPYNDFEYATKRVIDYIGGAILYVIFFAIKFHVKKKIDEQSPGKLYFIQNRVGLNLKNFRCYKFRTMHEHCVHNPYTQKNDSRVFEFGKFMRKTRMDELPQCINVLRGDMHLIGPRAEWDILVRNYEKAIPYYNERHLIRPGITGWAQVNYPYGENIEDAKQKLMYDLYYIKYWSLWLEIKTIFVTIAVMIRKKGL